MKSAQVIKVSSRSEQCPRAGAGADPKTEDMHWALAMQAYDFDGRYRSPSKMVVADALIRIERQPAVAFDNVVHEQPEMIKAVTTKKRTD